MGDINNSVCMYVSRLRIASEQAIFIRERRGMERRRREHSLHSSPLSRPQPSRELARGLVKENLTQKTVSRRLSGHESDLIGCLCFIAL